MTCLFYLLNRSDEHQNKEQPLCQSKVVFVIYTTKNCKSANSFACCCPFEEATYLQYRYEISHLNRVGDVLKNKSSASKLERIAARSSKKI